MSNAMTKDEFMALLNEQTALELTYARGEETEKTATRLNVIDKLLDASPWEIDMDTSQPVEKKSVDRSERMRG
jgi:hypothetical protein